MSDITGNGNMVMEAETGTALEGNSVLTDLVVEDMEIQFSPLLQDGIKSDIMTGIGDEKTWAISFILTGKWT